MPKHIEVIAHFDSSGKVIPYRIRYKDIKRQVQIIHIDRVMKCQDTRFNGHPMKIYTCRIKANGREKLITLHYEVNRCIWYYGAI